MKKSDLRSGMVVKVRSGIEYFVVIPDKYDYGTMFLMNKNGLTCNESYYEEDLTDEEGDSDFDIMEVYDAKVTGFSHAFNNLSSRLIWKREEVKEVTMKEVCEKFGCKVKIVEG